MTDYPEDSILQSALKLASLGMKIFPVHGILNGECTCKGKENCKPGKHPRVKKFSQLATTDMKKIRKWFLREFPNSNIGVLTGGASGVWVLDVDKKTAGYESLEKLENQYGPLPPTYRVRTGDGGEHYYFRYFDEYKIRCSVGKIGPGLDVRGYGGYVLGPGSNHLSGNSYGWIKGPDTVEIGQAPDWLLALIRESQKKPRKTLSNQTGLDGTFQQIVNGTRNNTLFENFACHLRDKDISKSRVEFICLALNQYSCREPLDEAEVLEAVTSAFNLPARTSRVRRISKASKRVLDLLTEWSTKTGSVQCTIKEIASAIGLSNGGTRERLKQLEIFGLLHIQEFYGKPSTYTPVSSDSVSQVSAKNKLNELDFFDTFRMIAEGNRTIALFEKLASQLRDRTISKVRVEIICGALNTYKCSIPLEEKDVLNAVDSAFTVPTRTTPMKSISDAAQRVLDVLNEWSQKTGFIECSVPEIASQVGLSQEGARKSLKQLERFGLIDICHNKGKPNRYTPSSPTLDSQSDPPTTPHVSTVVDKKEKKY